MNLKAVDFKAVAKRGCFVYAYLRHSDSKTARAHTPYYVGVAVSDRSGQRHRRPFGRHESAPVPADRKFIVVLRSGLTEEQAFNWERFYIFWYGREAEGGILLNKAEGGDVNHGWHHTEEYKQQASLNMQGREFTDIHRQRLSESWSYDRVEKIVATRRANGSYGNFRTPENIAKQKATLKANGGYKRTEQQIAKTKETKMRRTAERYGILYEVYVQLSEKVQNVLKTRWHRGKRGAELLAGLAI